MNAVAKFAVTISLIAASLVSSTGAWAKDVYLNQIPRINGISFDPDDADRFVVATYHGVFGVAPNGLTDHLAPGVGALTAMARHPSHPSTLIASGYKNQKTKLGVVLSDDGGRTWASVAQGWQGPVAFHSIAYSPSEPSIIYGVDKKIQISRDSGKTWNSVGETPARVFDIAVSADDPMRVYAATETGLLRSTDGGKNWKPAHKLKHPATMVDIQQNGTIHTFYYGTGFFRARDGELPAWSKISDGFADRALLDLEISPHDDQTMLAAADTGAVMISKDGGRNWRSFEGRLFATAPRIEAGRTLFEENCQACHGVRGVGEKLGDPVAPDEGEGPLAPALDDTMHAWHHADEQLIGTILEGLPESERMIAWKEQDMVREEAESIVAYMKSLWDFRALACQGPRHMGCMR
ncbi:MAG: c-type cytochrome [Rhodospirillales bacterium]|nr:c-type cytochrome [Rhodospirillales bacterium]